jgi:phosphoribosylamine--glycine ligase
LRFLGIGDTCDLGDLYYRLGQAGHEVKAYIALADAQDIYGGMITTVPDWREELAWIQEAGEEGVILFESAGMGVIQDALRATGYQVIGGSAYGDRLESERKFGQQICAEIGLQTAASHHFTDYDDALQFLKAPCVPATILVCWKTDQIFRPY